LLIDNSTTNIKKTNNRLSPFLNYIWTNVMCHGPPFLCSVSSGERRLFVFLILVVELSINNVTCLIISFHNIVNGCEFESRSWRYVLVTTLYDCQWLVAGWWFSQVCVLWFPPPINWPPQYSCNIVEIGIKLRTVKWYNALNSNILLFTAS
jgi:hypothetical protein